MTILRLNKNYLVLCNNDALLIYDRDKKDSKIIKTPSVVAPPNLSKSSEVFLPENKTIICMRVSENGQFIAVCLKNKQLVIYDSEFRVIKNVLTRRITSSVRFGYDNDLLVADKTGDVFVYKINHDAEPDAILGHFSMLLDVAINSSGQYIITCDRDEKIRVSSYPNAYSIISFCLGHREFVTKLEICDDVLISASGDGTIRFWDFTIGKQLGVVDTNKNVEDGSLANFCSMLDKEKVDVTALPVTDLQICKSNNGLYIGVILFGLQGVQLYHTNLCSHKLEVTFLQTVATESVLLSFCLSQDLFILTNNCLSTYCLSNDCYVKKSDDNLDMFCNKLKGMLCENVDEDIVNLYKRKYDNVQEYLERKKLRLECTASS